MVFPASVFFLLLFVNLVAGVIGNQDAQVHHNDVDDRIVIVKIGGSSITNKAKFEIYDEISLNWFAQTIQSSILTGNTKIIIVHGAGSFGHYQAKEFGFKGVSNDASIASSKEISNLDERSREGISKTRLSVQTLHLKLVSTLIQYGVNAVGISPFSISPIYDNDSDLKLLATSAIDVMNQGMVPVIHGDAVFRDGAAAAILGGDDIVSGIASYFAQTILKNNNSSCQENSPQIEVVFITDVDGVFTSDPKSNPDAELVELLEVSSEGKLYQLKDTKTVHASKSSHDHDVTGGLRSKLKAAFEIAQQNIKVVIVKCGSISALQAVQGEGVQVGTTVQLRDLKGGCANPEFN